MQYISQFCIIMGFSLVGEVLQRLIPVPVPASVYGIVLLFAALCLKIVKVEQVRQTGAFLRSILPVLFVPALVGLLENWTQIRDSVWIILLLTVATTVLTFGIAGRIAQAVTGKGGERDD